MLSAVASSNLRIALVLYTPSRIVASSCLSISFVRVGSATVRRDHPFWSKSAHAFPFSDTSRSIMWQRIVLPMDARRWMWSGALFRVGEGRIGGRTGAVPCRAVRTDADGRTDRADR